MTNKGERYHSDCPGCEDGHPSFWKTVIEIPQWEEWHDDQIKRSHALTLGELPKTVGLYDMSEVEECGWISQTHFQDFLKFTVEKERSR